MHKLKYLRVEFDARLQAHELPAFRGAIANKVGHGEILFHNHTAEGFRYAYPLIQYKVVGSRPAILCLGDGVDEIHKYFEKQDWSVKIGEREMEMKIWKLDMQQFTMQVWEKYFHYQIRNWIALDQKAWAEYQQMPGMSQRLRLLESKLTGNILSLGKGIGWTIDKQISCEITDLRDTSIVRVKGVSLTGFNLSFRSNVFLPNHIGLGGKVSLGYGVVTSERRGES